MKYLKCLSKIKDVITVQGEKIEIFELKDTIDEQAMNEWANHFRQQYCPDQLLDSLVEGTGLTKEEYLVEHKFPDKADGFGPGTRAGDFGELLISDYLEFVFNYFVPKERYRNKFNRNTSTQGSDVIGLKMMSINPTAEDEFLTVEVKTQSSGDNPNARLQDAVEGSYKDKIRSGETLSALKQIYIEKGKNKEAKIIQRFQNKPDRPYIEKYGAAALHDENNYSEEIIKRVILKEEKLWMIVIKRKNLKELISELYRRAAQCE